MAYMFLYIAYHGKIPGFGKIYYMIYCDDSMDNNVKTTMKTIKKVFLESAYLKSKFEDWTLNTDSVEFVAYDKLKYSLLYNTSYFNCSSFSYNRMFSGSFTSLKISIFISFWL